MLAERFLRRICGELGRTIVGFNEQVMAALMSYSFPGNVRELENIIERAAVLTKGQTILLEDLPSHVVGGDQRGMLSVDEDDSWSPMALTEAMLDPERRIILRALESNRWNRTKTAEDLEINRTTLYKKIKQYGLEEYGEAG